MITIPWRTGVNMREFAFYGTSALQHTSAELQRRQLQSLRDLGIKVVRIFASHRNFTTQQCIDRMRISLAAFDEFDMQAIVCLDDGLSGAGFFIKGTDGYHNQTQGHLNAEYWTSSAWRTHHLPHTSAFATAFADHPAILMWELGNEYALHPRDGGQRIPTRAQSAAFMEFARITSEAIKERSPRHLVTTGLVNTRHVCALEAGEDVNIFSRQLYSLASIDVISIHYYAHDGERQYAGTDVNTARALGKPYFIGEVGAHKSDSGDRADFYRREINEWRGSGAFTVLPWAFDNSEQDVGVSDLYAFARIHSHDYDRLRATLRDFAADVRRFGLMITQPKPTPDLVVTPPPPVIPVTPVVPVAPIVPIAPEVPVTPIIPIGERHRVPDDNGRRNKIVLPPELLIRLRYPMNWKYKVTSRFDDAAPYTGNIVKRREGMMFQPDTALRPLEVVAAQRGVISKVASYPPGYGNYVCIRHNWNGDDFVTWYAHLERSTVSEGQFVNAGDVIGFAGDSGSADETGLFFTVQYLNKGLQGYVVDDVIDPAWLLDPETPLLEEAQFEADITIADGTIMPAGHFFKKIWKVRNTGTTTWGEGYQLAFFADMPMGSGASVPVPITKPGETVQLAVEMTTPAVPGTYQSTWKLKTPQGKAFGAVLYTQIVVQAAETTPALRSMSRFDADVTIPDRTPIKPGAKFTKTWRILNDGETTWGDGFVLAYFKDDRMGAAESVPLPNIRPGKKGEVSIELTAPTTAGVHRSTWKPRDAQGNFFEYDLYSEILVDPNADEPGTLNPVILLDSPISGLKGREYYIGLRFMDKIDYLPDGKHKGVDYVSYNRAIGQAILASATGIVHFSKRCTVCTSDRPNFNAHGLTAAARRQAFSNLNPWNYGFGNLVVVRHEWNEISTSGRSAVLAMGYAEGQASIYVFYAHMNDVFVREGDRVVFGAQIGTLGDTGNSTTPHLHLEIRVTAKGEQRIFNTTKYKLLNPLTVFNE